MSSRLIFQEAKLFDFDTPFFCLYLKGSLSDKHKITLALVTARVIFLLPILLKYTMLRYDTFCVLSMANAK